ncbi:uncharacterized protein MELLADRAFT_66581 [Melampsora larici-populina 98AG31]|uniref:Uncharacterized protein n=1 Tax=Melampsora larici-populina (strain 98AG31 / pathotype 3-4-7) TaxID=747676 RepID=F4RZT6_MELLP|nr:uncharacterized protein MELLADRAFT_66581 [Melampsora larici-populina 98AG31]EGG02059.1 hypothetical protein MELLADRAFT_66581 [Melampsora larici-populina 98AG31]
MIALPVRREFLSPNTRPYGSVSSGVVTSRSSTNRSTDELRRIARKALQDHRNMFGNPLETPSVESILEAYERDGNGDTKLLMAILQAKRQEDERVAAHYDLQAANFNHVRRRTTMISNRSSSIQPCKAALQRQSSSSSTSTASTAPLANSAKRDRDSSEEPLSKGHNPKTKIIRLSPLKLSHTSSSSVKTFSAQSGSSFSGKSSKPRENASTCRPSSESPPLESVLTPRSSREGSTPAILTDVSPRSSPLSFSLARLLNDPITVTPHSSP